MDERHSAASKQSDSDERGILTTVKDRATTQLSNQKDKATGVVDVLANAVRHTTDQLRHDRHDTIARYVDRAAEQLEHFSGTLRDKEIGELMRDVRRFARRQPTLFIGGSFVAGLILARFLKSSPDTDDDHMEFDTAGRGTDRPYGSGDGQTLPAGGF
jgi:hypothetical protein